jgi:predicted SAM-dependent methyltransferase
MRRICGKTWRLPAESRKKPREEKSSVGSLPRPMRLNLGCGQLYRGGFVNVDAFDRTVADLLCGLTSLPLAGETFGLVECDHAIEHLGAIQATYALAECFRVMRRSGKLVIETPDIEASFRSFLRDRSVSSRSRLLTWIFGLDSPGQSHRMLYPARLLGKMLREAGFVDVRVRRPRTHLYREGLRVTAVRPGSRAGTVLSLFRVKVLAQGLIDVGDHLEGLEFERVFIRNMRFFHASPGRERRRIIENMVYSPAGVLLWCEAVRQAGMEIPPGLEKGEKLARLLVQASFSSRLVHAFHRAADIPARPGDAYERILSRARSVVSRLQGKAKKEVLACIRREFPGTGGRETVARAFSRRLVQAAVGKMQGRGIKSMALHRYEEAAGLLRPAVNSGVESLYAIVNYAVLSAICGKPGEAVRLYRAALTYGAGERMDSLLREEIIKCLLHMRDYKGVGREAEKLRSGPARSFWKAVVLVHGGDGSEGIRRLLRLREKGFRHECMAPYLAPAARRPGSKVPLPAMRAEPLVVGEEVHHRFEAAADPGRRAGR